MWHPEESMLVISFLFIHLLTSQTNTHVFSWKWNNSCNDTKSKMSCFFNSYTPSHMPEMYSFKAFNLLIIHSFSYSMNMRWCINPDSYFTKIVCKLFWKWYMNFNIYLLLSQNNTGVFSWRWPNSDIETKSRMLL